MDLIDQHILALEYVVVEDLWQDFHERSARLKARIFLITG